jgi:ureidoglycolate hydrolase
MQQSIKPQEITKENFTLFGQFILPCDNRKPFSEDDAQLDITRGTPRIYIMELPYKPLEFNKISRHINCSQCLGSSDNQEWYIAVCPANNSANIPDLSEIKFFIIPPNSLIKLNPGTWHEGPYFTYPNASFINLEHTDTVANDYFTYHFDEKYIFDVSSK